jgi:hypothetical protein
MLPVKELSPERVEMLASLIESLPHTDFEASDGFNMNHFSHACGSPSCIAGWAGSLMGHCRVDYQDFGPAILVDFLGCSPRQAHHLYSGDFSPRGGMDEITPSQAAAAIRNLLLPLRFRR